MGIDKSMKPVYALNYCLVCVTNNGKPYLNKEAQETVKTVIYDLMKKWNIHCKKVEVSECFVRVDFSASPSTSLINTVTSLKTVTSRKVKGVVSIPDGERLWERSYYLVTMDVATEMAVEMYIEHRKNFERRAYRRESPTV